MRFELQKMTLLDYPGKVACTVFTPGCSFRCPFCHNASLVHAGTEDGSMSRDELLAFLRKRQGILEGICVTGGEPLLQQELFDFLLEVRSMDYAVKLDTNGTFPEKLRRAVETGLVSYVAMDIKNRPEKYEQTAGFEGPELLDRVRESVDFLIHGDLPFEFRTTVVRPFHEPEDFAEIGKWIKGAKRYYLQGYTDTGDMLGDASKMSALSGEEMRQCLEAVLPYVPEAGLRGV